MNLNTKDWVDFCKGRKYFDKSHFLTLLMKINYSKPIDDEDYNNLFCFFPNESSELKKRLSSYFEEKPKINSKEDYLISNTKKDLAEKLLVIEDDYNKTNLAQEVKYHDDYGFIEENLNEEDHGQFFSELFDFMVTQKKSKDKKIYALFEAYYGLTNNYQMVWYLGAPLLKSKINFDYYYNIWKVGGEYVITDKGIYVSAL